MNKGLWGSKGRGVGEASAIDTKREKM